MPDGTFVRRLRNALLSAYSTATLKQMLSGRLNVRLEEIAGGGSLAEQVDRLIEWFDLQDRLTELVWAACEENPTNEELRSFRNAYLRLDRPQRKAMLRPQSRIETSGEMDVEALEQLRQLTQRLEIIVEDGSIGLRKQIESQNQRLDEIEGRLHWVTFGLWVLAAGTGVTSILILWHMWG